MWSNIKQTIKIVWVLSLLGAIVWAVFIYEQSPYSFKRTIGVHQPLTFTSWVVNWDFERSRADMKVILESLESVQLFFAYFNEKDELIWNEQEKNQVDLILQDISELNDANKPLLYLTVVNDIIYHDGTSKPKDDGLISRLLYSQDIQYKFINDLIAIIKAHQLDGVEIDFENIATEDWNRLVVFYEILYNQLKSEHIKLRIVLEPKIKFKEVFLPEGPEYVVMAYNLYGTHSGPGPKANKNFLGELTAKMENIQGEATIAIATGGFKWGEDGTVKSITEQEAIHLQKEEHIDSITRDEESSAITYTYVDSNHVRQTVWYADEVTLKDWSRILQQRGYSKIAIWRLGQWSDETLMLFNQINRKFELN